MVKNWKAVFSRVKGALMRRGRTRHEADDLVQEAWVRLASYEQKRAVARPEAFLMRTALNLSIDGYRARRNHGAHVLLEEVTLVDSAPSAESRVLARERLAHLSECLAALDARTLRIFLDHRMDGLSYLEIARRHGLSVSAVEKHIAKASFEITRLMEGWYP